MDAQIQVTPEGKQILVVTEYDEHGPIEHGIPLAAIAAWRELLGIDDPVGVVEAILHVGKHGEPEPDPVTGENAWTEPYGLLQERERVREDEAFRAEKETADPALIVKRSEKAAHAAVHVPDSTGESRLDKCRRGARERLGIPAATKNPGVETRRQPPGIPDATASKVAELLADKTGELLVCTRRFLHGLTEHEPDPLTDDPGADDD